MPMQKNKVECKNNISSIVYTQKFIGMLKNVASHSNYLGKTQNDINKTLAIGKCFYVDS